jgi:thiol-disulfide isomerase/thioredoxin
MFRSVSFGVALALGAAPLFAQESDAAAAKPAAPAKQDRKQVTPIAIGSSVPDGLTLRDVDGKEFSFAAQQGKVVLLHFWSFTCPWEKVAEPKLNQLATDFQGKDVVMVAINANRNEIGEAPDPAAFAAEDEKARPYARVRKQLEKLNHRVLFDHDGEAGRVFGARTTPHCFVIDKNGTLVYGGGLDNDGKNVEVDPQDQFARLAVEAALAGKPVAVSTTKPYG